MPPPTIDAWKYKTQYCEKFTSTGKCKYGSRCMFAHGEHDLRSVQLNRAEGVSNLDGIRRLRKRCAMHYDVQPLPMSDFELCSEGGDAMSQQQLAFGSLPTFVNIMHENFPVEVVTYVHNPYGFKCCDDAQTRGVVFYPQHHSCAEYSTVGERSSSFISAASM